MFSDGKYCVGRQRRLAIKGKLKDAPGNVESTANVKRDSMPRFLSITLLYIKSRAD